MRHLFAIFLVAAAAGAAVVPGKATATPVPPRAKPVPPLPAAPPLVLEAPQLKVEDVRVELPRIDLVSRSAIEPPPEPEPVKVVPREASGEAHRSFWDELAACESGGWTDSGFVPDSAQWDASGYFDGGLQFTEETWLAYRSDDDPWTASEASREQQIAVARRVLEKQGENAWPVCSQWVSLS